MPSYEVTTIKPAVDNGPMPSQTVRQYIMFAYDAGSGFTFGPALNNSESQILGGPDWIDKDRYDIVSKPSQELREAMQTMSSEQRLEQYRMLQQSLLAERFHLKVHFETRDMSVLELVPAKGGLKIRPVAAPPATPPPPPPPPGGPSRPPPPGAMMLGFAASGVRTVNARSVPMARLIDVLRGQATELGNKPIVDKTGFTGFFDIDHLEWAGLPAPGKDPPPDVPFITTALDEKLGLKLVPARGQVEVLIIDSIERPSAN